MMLILIAWWIIYLLLPNSDAQNWQVKEHTTLSYDSFTGSEERGWLKCVLFHNQDGNHSWGCGIISSLNYKRIRFKSHMILGRIRTLASHRTEGLSSFCLCFPQFHGPLSRAAPNIAACFIKTSKGESPLARWVTNLRSIILQVASHYLCCINLSSRSCPYSMKWVYSWHDYQKEGVN